MHVNRINEAIQKINEQLGTAVIKAHAAGALPVSELPAFETASPKERTHGDLFSNFALQAARSFSMPPRKIAETVLAHFDGGSLIEKAEIAGPGFVNFTLSPEFFSSVILAVTEAKEDYGKSDAGRGKKVMVEFVSANPTGPMHMGNARGGVIGDTLSTCLELTGHDVSREFYVNDAGNQVDLLSRSLEARYIQQLKGEDAIAFPEDGYHGDDVKTIAAEYIDKFGDSLIECAEGLRREKLVTFGLERNIANMKRDLARYKISYDCWFFESTLHTSGYVDETIDLLTKRGHTYTKEDALWFEATKFGCEKDEVMRKSNGFYTYFAVDIAYHRNKFEARGFDEVIDVLGADHHGHTVRFKAGLSALGLDPDGLDFVLMQLVKLMRDGEIVRMSKRTGKAISLTDLLDEIPVDAARFFFASRTPDSPMDFDLGLAVKQDSDNPVYYVQYAHARICSILRALETDGIKILTASDCDLSLLTDPAERELIFKLATLPNEIIASAKSKDPSRITRFAVDTAALFHKFYNSCRVRCDDRPLMDARIALCYAAKQVLKNVCGIIKIDAPERM